MSDHWIQSSIKHSGALRAKAQAAGMSTEAFAQKHKGAPGILGHQARLGITLMHLAKHKSTKPKVTIGSNTK